MYESEHAKRAVALAKEFNGIIAGGYVRDVALGVEPKDIDVFFPAGVRHAVMQSLRSEFTKADVPDYAAHPYVRSVYKSLEYPMDIVFTNVAPVLHVFNGFDLGICKCYTDCNSPAIFHQHFLEDVRNKTITYRRDTTLHNDKLVMLHAHRLQQKYPDHVVQVIYETT